MSKNYSFLAMSQKDMFKNQVLEELLRERLTYYAEKKKEVDFWIVLSPTFLKSTSIKQELIETNYYKQSNSISLKDDFHKSLSSILSTNKEFIEWMKLRLGYFDTLTFIDSKILKLKSIEQTEQTEQTEQKENKTFCKSNGVCGEIKYPEKILISPLTNENFHLNKDILLEKLNYTFYTFSI